MAIVRDLPESAVLWKYTTTERRVQRDPNNYYRYMRDENGRYIYEDATIYHHIRLYTRRARTNGCVIPDQMKPFVDKLKIRTRNEEYWGQGRYQIRYRAIGCEDAVVTEEEYNNTPLHEVAEKYYERINNQDLILLMNNKTEMNLAVLAEMKTLIEEMADIIAATEATEMTDEEANNLPAEPDFWKDYRHAEMWAN